VSRKKIAENVEHRVQTPVRELAVTTIFQSVSVSELIHSCAMKSEIVVRQIQKLSHVNSEHICGRDKTMMNTGDIEAFTQATYTQEL